MDSSAALSLLHYAVSYKTLADDIEVLATEKGCDVIVDDVRYLTE